jgi:outer membrane receptor protein involved in Fe transport
MGVAALSWWLSTTAAAEDGDIEAIEVLATRPKPTQSDQLAPTTIIDGDAIARSGAATIDEILQRLPSMGFQGVNQNQNNGGFGVSFLDLRNLNFNRSLVLIDGRRVVLSGIQTDEAVDVANIPAAFVDHVEVMPDGTAPKYGADAVAGVVNIVLKQHLSGLTASLGSGISGYSDGGTADVALTFGENLDHGNFALSAAWTRRDPIMQFSRPWARDPIDTATLAADGTLLVTRGSPASLSGNAVTAGGPVGPSTGNYDTSVESYLRGGLNRTALNAIGHYDLSDRLSAFSELSYSDKVSETQLPPQILGLGGTPKNPDGFVIPADNPYNPYGQAVTLQRVLGEVGNLDTRSDTEVFRVVAGLEGRFSPDSTWSLSYNHGESRTGYDTNNSVNLTRALDTVSNNPSQCPASQGCVSADYFAAGSLSPAAASYIRYTDVTTSEYLETVAQASLTQDFHVLRDLQWVATADAEYRKEYGQTIPSSVVLAGDQAGGASAVTEGGYDTREVAVDLDLPLLRDRRIAKSLTAELSGRYVSTSLFGNFPVWKLALAWAPVPGLQFRGGLGTARRVPAITEAFAGSTTSLLDISDPCDATNGLLTNSVVAANCRSLGLPATFRQSSPLIQVASGGNEYLKPESSRSYNLGVQTEPGLLGPVVVSVDYYKIAVSDAIDSLTDADPNYIPNQCFLSVNLSSPLCSLITRTPAGPSVGQISRIYAPDQNIGGIATDGIDVGLNYRFERPAGGTFRIDWNSAYLLDYLVQEVPGSAFIQEAGTFPNVTDAGGLPRLKSLLSLEFERSGWSAGWSVRYIGPASVLGLTPGSPFSRAPGIFYHDLNAGWRAGKFDFDFGIDNILDQKPPTLIDGVSNTNLNTYDVIGRYFHLRAMLQW